MPGFAQNLQICNQMKLYKFSKDQTIIFLNNLCQYE